MLVTFKTDAYSNVNLFGNIAQTFLKIMGHSGTVPGSLSAAEVPAALDRLSRAIASEQFSQPSAEAANDDDDEPTVSLRNRALPLIELLKAAEDDNAAIMWE
ncbi:DUF1840 family protein [Hahella sp. KA22]|uniref:DUF1840 domain-containing protein n=1 Tax=Hahella sp. KA22 TaxID=1628392 RepID=UPI000FDF307F|nr:DUF1840 domain-containing protein [Hahella sp. KA22]AZZ94861.1 DUF1840 domain-containing protein [Hahella sp. KA22]QAY58234.1 DUF1840 family protein [Hahella sp. KA22]